MINSDFQPISGLGWIDFSAEDKDKVMKVIALLKEEGTVDELGVGVIRNALSDVMFNGITTIQTRAKYFFIVPRIIQSFINQKKRDTSLLRYLHNEETRIMNELTWALEDPEKQGIIGYTVALENKNRPKRQWKEVERKPSAIYWNGIRTFGICNTQYSLQNFLSAIEQKEKRKTKLGYVPLDDESKDDWDAEVESKFYFHLPDYNPDWDKDLSIELTEEEGNFLRHKIIDTQKEQLIALVLDNKERISQFLDAKSFEEMSKMPFVKTLPEDTKNIIYTARDFWRILYGAHIRYNVILHQIQENEKRITEFQEKWARWLEDMNKFKKNDFNREFMWELVLSRSRVQHYTKRFVNAWIDEIFKDNPRENILDEMVIDQERSNKGKRSKLNHQHDVKYSEWVGINSMDFRFSNAQKIIQDIAKSTGLVND